MDERYKPVLVSARPIPQGAATRHGSVAAEDVYGIIYDHLVGDDLK